MISPAIAVIAELIRARGTLIDKELYENVRNALNTFDMDISRKDFNKLLMTLELRGYIRVEGIKKEARIVHLVKVPSKSGGK